MTIKEMESICGMNRTNIRFYESEGLIRPARRENGYREYSEEDARTLQKVKLLRAMEIPLEEVKALCASDTELREVLTRLSQTLDRRQLHQERTREAVRQMLRAETHFGNLDPEEYLSLLETGEASWKGDEKPRLNLPWRRYWARLLDFSLCGFLVDAVLMVFPVWGYGRLPLSLLTILLLEPLALHLFATTPGKAIFGIWVTDPEGRRLSYGNALERTWTVLWEGEALRIPIVSHYFMYKSLRDAEDEETLPWEWDSELTCADDKNWRYVLYFAVLAVLEIILMWPVLGGG